MLPPCRQFFTTVRQQISMDFDFSSLQIANVFYGRPFTLIPERILRSCYCQSPKRIDLCATWQCNLFLSFDKIRLRDNNAYDLPLFFFSSAVIFHYLKYVSFFNIFDLLQYKVFRAWHKILNWSLNIIRVFRGTLREPKFTQITEILLCRRTRVGCKQAWLFYFYFLHTLDRTKVGH